MSVLWEGHGDTYFEKSVSPAVADYLHSCSPHHFVRRTVSCKRRFLCHLATYDGVINPFAGKYLHDAIVDAQERKAQALIIRLNTPGGLDPSMRLILSPWAGAKWTRR